MLPAKGRADGSSYSKTQAGRAAATPLEQRDVHSPFAVYYGKHGGGFYAIVQVLYYAITNAFWHLDHAAIAIGFAVLFDGLTAESRV